MLHLNRAIRPCHLSMILVKCVYICLCVTVDVCVHVSLYLFARPGKSTSTAVVSFFVSPHLPLPPKQPTAVGVNPRRANPVTPPLRQGHWNAATTRSVDAVGQACLKHVIGDGQDGLWGRRYLKATTTTSPLPRDASRGVYGDDDGVRWSTLMLAARLQGMLALGHGLTIARALTATARVSEGGDWKLVDALPVQVKRGGF